MKVQTLSGLIKLPRLFGGQGGGSNYHTVGALRTVSLVVYTTKPKKGFLKPQSGLFITLLLFIEVYVYLLPRRFLNNSFTYPKMDYIYK